MISCNGFFKARNFVFFIIIIGLFITESAVSDVKKINVVFPFGETENDFRRQYFWSLLKAALDVTSTSPSNFTLSQTTKALPQNRAAIEAAGSHGVINITVRTSNPLLDQSLRPIEFPLDKGLAGCRLLLTHKSAVSKIRTLNTVEELKNLSYGFGLQWPDVAIMKYNDFNNQVLVDNYPSLFPMLVGGRFDILSRGINEVSFEKKAFKVEFEQIEVLSQVALYYPLAFVFYVGRDVEGELLAKRIRDGLLTLQKSGVFDRMYQTYKVELMKGVSMPKKIIKLSNPNLNRNLPALNDKLWWDTPCGIVPPHTIRTNQ